MKQCAASAFVPLRMERSGFLFGFVVLIQPIVRKEMFQIFELLAKRF